MNVTILLSFKYNTLIPVGNGVIGSNIVILLFPKSKILNPVNPPTLLTKVTPLLFKSNVLIPSTEIVASNLSATKLNAVTLTEVAPKEVNHVTNVGSFVTGGKPTKFQFASTSKL